MDFALRGLDRALAAVKRVGAAVNNDRIGNNAAAALQPVVEDAKALVPVQSGVLRDSIGIAREFLDGAATDGQSVFVGPLAAGGRNVAFYGHFLEFGTVHMRATPFLGPAVKENEALIFDVLGNRVGADIEGAI